jgi:phage recombination protein Bet
MNAITKAKGDLAPEERAAVLEKHGAREVSDSSMIEVLRSSFYPDASPESVALVLGYCRASGLDPMKRPVHIVPIYSRKAGGMVDVVLPGIALYRILAARSGAYAGKSEPEFGPDVTTTLGGTKITYPAWCRVTVFKLVGGQVREFPAKEYWLENYATAKRDTDAPNAMWKKRPYGQLAKCAEAQALRMAFPEEAGGTYTAEEMEGKDLAPAIELRSEPAPTRDPEPSRAALSAPKESGPDKVQAGVDALCGRLELVHTMDEMNAVIGDPAVTKQREWLAAKRPDLAQLLEDAISATVERLAADDGFPGVVTREDAP